MEIPLEALVRDRRDEFGKFFLSLALAFNDYKGVVLLERALKEMRRPPPGTLTPAAAEWHGIAVQTHRLMAVVTTAVLELLTMNPASLGDLEMAQVLAAMRIEQKPKWFWLVDAATKGKSPEARELLSVVRSKLTAHYCAKDVIWRGLTKRFREEPKTTRNNVPRASIGSTVPECRFFYADAAVQAAIETADAHDDETRSDERIVKLAAEAFTAVGAVVAAFVAVRRGSLRQEGRSQVGRRRRRR